MIRARIERSVDSSAISYENRESNAAKSVMESESRRALRGKKNLEMTDLK